jgi:predicted nucleic acid-binding protein
MSLIVDASVAVKWVVEEPGSGSARDLVANGPPLLAPDLVLLEVGNALRKKLMRGLIGRAQANDGASGVERAFADLAATRPLSAVAVKLALELGYPVYDCVYLALAARESVPLVTADDRLFEAARRARIEARML